MSYADKLLAAMAAAYRLGLRVDTDSAYTLCEADWRPLGRYASVDALLDAMAEREAGR